MALGRGRRTERAEAAPAFADLRAAVLQFAGRVEAPCTSASLGEQVVHLAGTRDIINRELAALVSRFSATDEADCQGSVSPLDWVRHHARVSAADASQLSVVGAHLSEMPRGSEALARGLVGFGHLVHMARNAEFAANSTTGVFDEVPLLEFAAAQSVNQFRYTCMNARHAQDPAGVVEAEVDAVEQRSLTIHERGDGSNTTWFNICLDNPTAAFTRSVLEKLSERLGPDDLRCRDRRLADAFVELVHAPLSEFDGRQVVGKNVHVNVTCTLETLLNLPGAPGAEVEFGAPISSAAVGRLACDATICKILLDDKLIPVAVGHMKRTLSKAERRALNARDQHCRWRDCTRPAARCDGHHIRWWSRGGASKLDNMLLLCKHHHWRVHEGGWKLALDPQGEVVVVPPQLFNRPRAPEPRTL